MKQYNIVSGWNRGGTSCLMALLREAGVPIVGFKYPFEFETVEIEDGKIKGQKKIDTGLYLPYKKETKNINPSGFWEIPSICLGEGLQERHGEIGENGDLIKVPLGVLPSSNPDLVNKVIIILRDPLKVIKSQLKTNKPKNEEEWIRVASIGLIYNLLVSLKWIGKNKKEGWLLYYEDLLKDPEQELLDIGAFLGRPVYLPATKIINKELDRSEKIRAKYKETKQLVKFYKEKDFNWTHYNLEKMKKEIDKIKKQYL